jgi:hypothetical protein
MRHFASGSAKSSLVGSVDVARWEQYGLGGTLPFDAMWYTVPPSSSSPRDCHPQVEADGQRTEVAQGSAFLLDSEEAHVIHNESADEPLLVFTTYWMPLTGAQR